MNASDVVPVLLGLIGGGGLIGGAVALVKLPGDRSAGAVSTMQAVMLDLRAAWIRARRRSVFWKLRAHRAEAALRAAGLPIPPEPTAAEVEIMLEGEDDDELVA